MFWDATAKGNMIIIMCKQFDHRRGDTMVISDAATIVGLTIMLHHSYRHSANHSVGGKHDLNSNQSIRFKWSLHGFLLLLFRLLFVTDGDCDLVYLHVE